MKKPASAVPDRVFQGALLSAAIGLLAVLGGVAWEVGSMAAPAVEHT